MHAAAHNVIVELPKWIWLVWIWLFVKFSQSDARLHIWEFKVTNGVRVQHNDDDVIDLVLKCKWKCNKFHIYYCLVFTRHWKYADIYQ